MHVLLNDSYNIQRIVALNYIYIYICSDNKLNGQKYVLNNICLQCGVHPPTNFEYLFAQYSKRDIWCNSNPSKGVWTLPSRQSVTSQVNALNSLNVWIHNPVTF